MKLNRTGKHMAFLDVSIGAVFFAHERFWTRNDYAVATVLAGSAERMGSACNFIDDGGAKSNDGRNCESVEIVELTE